MLRTHEENSSFPRKKNRFWPLCRCNQMPWTSRNTWFTSYVRTVFWATVWYMYHATTSSKNSGRSRLQIGWKSKINIFFHIHIIKCYFENTTTILMPIFCTINVKITFYCMSKKSWPILCSISLYPIGQDLLDTQYEMISNNAKVWQKVVFPAKPVLNAEFIHKKWYNTDIVSICSV